MKNYKNLRASVNSIESFGLVDGPGIRVVIFFNGCSLRCKFCHNPEMFQMQEANTTVEELVTKIKRFKPYFKNNGGVTYSGGEPLLQVDFLIQLSKALKEEGIHIALDTAGVGIGKYDEILDLVDLVILDIKHLTPLGYENLVNHKMDEFLHFVEVLKKHNKDLWIRQVIVPGIHDNSKYMENLVSYLKTLTNIKRIEFLPFHKMGDEKYEKLGIPNPLKNTPEMDGVKCRRLYEKYIEANFDL